ncbi:hypothetical protein N7539_006004 [Penicillium diatomitis]|uniref:IQ calmodulin-binding motif protein n=1 Tax=Penicillium diatomitis TaxID=2819901 RepID=A0A9X0BU08_9EURO|nr:uncharacterized protein N7539_006004 [Penicillium diatomitis]KAJ5484208.1 hypothetical protein N7539_006004 [Penicillium diatomitis]
MTAAMMPASVEQEPHNSPATHQNATTDVTPASNPEQAARTIQRTYRGYRTRRELGGCGIAAPSRWLQTLDIARQQRIDNATPPEISSDEGLTKDDETESDEDLDGNLNTAQKNWQRAISIAKQATGSEESAADGTDDGASHRSGAKASACPHKMMGLEYFLEMVDSKHRHGSNLRAYHAAWKESPSNQNFFYWLDHGEGKNVELPQCTREQLEKDQVRYLTPSERFNYLVEIDDAGLLRWAKNGELVETDSSRFQDSLHGVVRIEEHEASNQEDSTQHTNELAVPAPASADVPPSDVVISNTDTKNPNVSAKEDYELDKAVKNFSKIRPAVVYDHFAGGLSIKNGMWIFVADTSFRIYIGIKAPGAFQHSSFLRGGRISAAGLIKTRNGQIRGFAPLSGHYRPHLSNFRAFHRSLHERGADLSRVSMTKSYAILAGVEGWTRTKRKVKGAKRKLGEAKQKINLTHARSDKPTDEPAR